jgi:hypothetical protein
MHHFCKDSSCPKGLILINFITICTTELFNGPFMLVSTSGLLSRWSRVRVSPGSQEGLDLKNQAFFILYLKRFNS